MQPARKPDPDSHWEMQDPDGDFRVGKAGVIINSGLKVEIAPSRLSDLGKIAHAFADAVSAEGIPCEVGPNLDREDSSKALHVLIGEKR